MSNYTKTTNFGAKDTLPPGDSQKIIRGTEFDTEFNNIATAVATKLEVDGSNNLVLAGTASATKFIPTGGTASGNGLYLPTANTLALSTNGVERVRLDSSGNLLVGTATGFTTTGAAGSVAVSGYGIYPWTNYFSGSVTTNSTQFVGVNYESPSFTVDGSSVTTVWGVFSRLRGSVSGAGGNNGITLGATGGRSTVLTTASATPVSLLGGHFSATRSMSTDVSSASNNSLYGSLSFAGMDGSVGTGASSGVIRGLRSSIWSGAGTTTTFQSVEAIAEATWASTDKSSTITNAHAYYGRLRFGKESGADTSSVTNAYGVGLDALDIRATATVTNYYAFYAAAPTVTGTLTNRWGVYIDDASSPNYFAGSVQVGAGTAAAPTLTTIADTNTGVFFPAADVVGVSTGGTERARVKSTGQVRFVPLSADPAGAESGDVYYNSTSNKLKVYNGTAWVDLH